MSRWDKKLSSEPKVETRYSSAPIEQMQCCLQAGVHRLQLKCLRSQVFLLAFVSNSSLNNAGVTTSNIGGSSHIPFYRNTCR